MQIPHSDGAFNESGSEGLDSDDGFSLLIGGVTPLSLGIIGEYIGKIYMETKHRPRYIIDTFVWKEESAQSDKEK